MQILHDLLQDEHFATDELLLEVALELALTELMALFEQFLVLVDQKDAIAALEQQVIDFLKLCNLVRAESVQLAQFSQEVAMLLVDFLVE